MGFAIKNDRTGARGIPSDQGKYNKKDIGKDEFYAETLEGIEFPLLRAAAYADPLNGSDRHYAEASRLNMTGGAEEDIKNAISLGDAARAKIQGDFPYGE